MKKHEVDLEGIHFCTGCNLQGVRINTHDRVRDLICSIFSYCGIGIRKEQRNAFRSVDPDAGLRSDITLYRLPSRAPGAYHVDIRITSPVPASVHSQLTVSQATQPFRAGKKSICEKKKKYKVLVEQCQMKFIPIVFEISGKMDANFTALLREVLGFASEERQIPLGPLWHYWVSALMVCLQKHLMEGVQTRSFSLNSRGFTETFESSRSTVHEIDYLDVSPSDRVDDR
jgi:hypothetical protein